MPSGELRPILDTAINLHNGGHLDEAETLYRQILAAQPEHPDALHLLGLTAYQRGDAAAALPLIRRATQLLPRESSCHNNLGLVLSALGKDQEALASFLRAIELHPTYAEAYGNMGTTLRHMGQQQEAAFCLRRALELAPDNAQAHINLGALLSDQGRLEEAAAQFQTALSLVPDNTDILTNLGFTLFRLDRLDEAEARLRDAVAQQPDHAWAWNNLGVVLTQRGKFCEAAECFRRALGADPTHPFAAANLPQTEKACAAEDAARRSILAHAGESGLKGLPSLLQQTTSFSYAVEVAEACNLRCPSCPQGNLRNAGRHRGLMSLDLYRRVLEKIRRESPVGNPVLWLFNWGEAFLHPELPELVRLTKQAGFYCMLSTNLNIDRGLEEVLAAGPDELKISLSGMSQEVYGATHARGDAERVIANLKRLREIENRVRSGANIWIGFHLYRHNLAERDAMEQLAGSLGFGFTPHMATLYPMEKMVEHLEGRLPAKERALVDDYLLLDPAEVVRIKRPYLVESADCEARYNMMSIGHDGMVDLCCNTFLPENRLGLNFLDTPHDELQAAKYRHPFCGECYRHGLQMQVLGEEALNAVQRAENDAIAEAMKRG